MSRLLALSGGDINVLKGDVDSATVGDDLIASTIRSIADKSGYIVDPHTAVGVASLSLHRRGKPEGLVFATAHPDKSRELMASILGRDVATCSGLSQTPSGSYRPDRLPPTYPALKKYILSHQ